MSRNERIRHRTGLAAIHVPAVDELIRSAVEAAPDLPADLAERLTELIRAVPDGRAAFASPEPVVA